MLHLRLQVGHAPGGRGHLSARLLSTYIGGSSVGLNVNVGSWARRMDRGAAYQLALKCQRVAPPGSTVWRAVARSGKRR